MDFEDSLDAYPMIDAIDKEILMHRDVHFGGKFSIMQEYYEVGGKGIHPEFDLKRIELLAQMENEMGENMAPLVLTGSDAEKVGRALDAYKMLRDLYEEENPKSKLPLLIADLILSEEEEAEEEVKAIVEQNRVIIPHLLDLLRSVDYHDPLFPGYGHAPFLAAKCLGLIGDERAVFSLFECLGDGDFGDEKMVLSALRTAGEPAKKLLLKVAKSEPIKEDNERAALGMIAFQDDPEVRETALTLLEKPESLESDSFATYLICVCEGLKTDDEKKRFLSLLERNDLPDYMKRDIEAVAKEH